MLDRPATRVGFCFKLKGLACTGCDRRWFHISRETTTVDLNSKSGLVCVHEDCLVTRGWLPRILQIAASGPCLGSYMGRGRQLLVLLRSSSGMIIRCTEAFQFTFPRVNAQFDPDEVVELISLLRDVHSTTQSSPSQTPVEHDQRFAKNRLRSRSNTAPPQTAPS